MVQPVPVSVSGPLQSLRIAAMIIDLCSDDEGVENLKPKTNVGKNTRKRSCARPPKDEVSSDEEVPKDEIQKKKKKLGNETSITTTTTTTTTSSSVSNNSRVEKAYLAARAKGVRSRTFDLRKIPAKEVIPTGRTIKKMAAWSSSLWPALREFLQNTIDHLSLLDNSTGRINAALTLSADIEGSSTIYRFKCNDELICSIYTIDSDELVIEQAYTFPIPPRALDTGVPDTSKQNSITAGGFGDGFKTAAVALLALGEPTCNSLTWTFHALNSTITWDFVGCRREAVGSFAASKVLEVHIQHSELDQDQDQEAAPRHRHALVPETNKENWMVQRVKVRGIGPAFLREAVPRLQVFWAPDSPPSPSLSLSPSPSPSSIQMLSISAHPSGGGDYLARASSVPLVSPTPNSTTPPSPSHALPGVYVKGIYIRAPKIEVHIYISIIICIYIYIIIK